MPGLNIEKSSNMNQYEAPLSSKSTVNSKDKKISEQSLHIFSHHSSTAISTPVRLIDRSDNQQNCVNQLFNGAVNRPKFLNKPLPQIPGSLSPNSTHTSASSVRPPIPSTPKPNVDLRSYSRPTPAYVSPTPLLSTALTSKSSHSQIANTQKLAQNPDQAQIREVFLESAAQYLIDRPTIETLERSFKGLIAGKELMLNSKGELEVRQKKGIFESLFGWITRAKKDQAALTALNKSVEQMIKILDTRKDIQEIAQFSQKYDTVLTSKWMNRALKGDREFEKIFGTTLKKSIATMSLSISIKLIQSHMAELRNNPSIQAALKKNASNETISQAREILKNSEKNGWGLLRDDSSLAFDKILLPGIQNTLEEFKREILNPIWREPR
ncbi:MAG: hypothetical protein QRY74_02610 [Chlamydia sp.]